MGILLKWSWKCCSLYYFGSTAAFAGSFASGDAGNNSISTYYGNEPGSIGAGDPSPTDDAGDARAKNNNVGSSGDAGNEAYSVGADGAAGNALIGTAIVTEAGNNNAN